MQRRSFFGAVAACLGLPWLKPLIGDEHTAESCVGVPLIAGVWVIAEWDCCDGVWRVVEVTDCV